MKLRIATYNLFEGANASYNRLVEFVRKSDIDVLCLQEINGWHERDAERMRDFTDRGLFVQYAYGNSNTPYKLATFSKLGFIKSDAYIEGYWHSVVETRVQLEGGGQLAILNVHLDPWQEQSRVRELDRLLRTIDRSLPTIITGDFNSLSRHDNYDASMLAELQHRGITKYGRSSLEFSVTDFLEQAGFVDVASQFGSMQPTVPTSASQDKDHEVPARIDYMFATPDIAAFVRQVEVAANDLTNTISDHYPVIATFEIGLAATATATAELTQQQPSQPGAAPVVSAADLGEQPSSPAAIRQDDQDGTVFIINHDDE